MTSEISFLEGQIKRRVHTSLTEKDYSQIFQKLIFRCPLPYRSSSGDRPGPIHKKLGKNMDYHILELPHQIQLDKVEIEINTLICSPCIIVIIAVRLFVQSLESSTRRPAW